jgi:hypothetical protein
MVNSPTFPVTHADRDLACQEEVEGMPSVKAVLR